MSPQPGLLQHAGWLLGGQVSATYLRSGMTWCTRLGLYSKKKREHILEGKTQSKTPSRTHSNLIHDADKKKRGGEFLLVPFCIKYHGSPSLYMLHTLFTGQTQFLVFNLHTVLGFENVNLSKE